VNSPISTENRLVSSRVSAFFLVLVVVFGYYTFRLFSLQIINGKQFVDQANDNRKDEISVATNRGMILDRNDYILARNTPSYNVVITPAFLPEDDGEIQEIYRELSPMIDVPAFGPEPDEAMAKNFNECRGLELAISQVVYIAGSLAPFNPVKVKCNVDKDIALMIEEKRSEWPGVGIQIEPVREYPTGELTAEVIGFLGPIPAGFEEAYPGFEPNRDKVGYAGVEQRLQETLGGTPGKRVVELDGLGKELRDIAVQIDPIPGNYVRLTIDTRLQLAAKAAIKEAIDQLHGTQPNIKESIGAVIAMDPRTGEILALVSYPTFENNRMAREIPDYYYRQLNLDPNLPLFNHAISSEHPPGSVFKMAAALGILNEGVVTPDFTIEDPGQISIVEKFLEHEVGRTRKFVCHKLDGHGTVDYLTGIAQSCDVYFYKVGGGFEDEVPDGGLGIWRLGEYARALGYDLRTGIELPGEENGLIPDPDWKRLTIGENWSTGDTYIGTIGQGYVLSTPLQVLRSIATIANDGVMVKPTLVKDILDPEGKVIKAFETNEVCDITGECTLSCEVSTGRCVIDTLQLCDVAAGTCKLTTDPEDTRIDPDQIPKRGGVINVLDENGDPTGETKVIAPWIVQLAKEGMGLAVSEGTAHGAFRDWDLQIQTGGKTGTAEYCDKYAIAQDLCDFGKWPAHAWYVGFAPYDNPEIAVVAFVYHGSEGATVAAPIVEQVMKTYFGLKTNDEAQSRTE